MASLYIGWRATGCDDAGEDRAQHQLRLLSGHDVTDGACLFRPKCQKRNVVHLVRWAHSSRCRIAAFSFCLGGRA